MSSSTLQQPAYLSTGEVRWSRRLAGLARADLRLVARDGFLGFLLFYPLVLTLILRWALPAASAQLADRFDLTAYYPLIVGYQFVLLTPIMFGVVAGLMLLDEKDEHTLTAIRVTPLPRRAWLAWRLLPAYVLAVVYSLLLLWAVGLHPGSLLPVVPVALVVALEAPAFALFLSAFAANKVEGLAFMKAMGIFLVAPLADWFFDASWTALLGIFPTYWPVKAYWISSVDGSTGSLFWLHLAIGLAYHLLLILWMMRRFNRATAR